MMRLNLLRASSHGTRLAILLIVVLAVVPGLVTRAEADDDKVETWSTTWTAQARFFDSDYADDDVAGFFDQYEYTPNKGSGFPFELGLREARYDLYDPGHMPRLQVRVWSPTSNLGLSGSGIDEPFWNTHVDVIGRREGVDLDVRYRRLRTEGLRLFPNTGGGPITFGDLTRADRRFMRDRTGIDAELRLQIEKLFASVNERESDSEDAEKNGIGLLGAIVYLRGSYEARDGYLQERAMVDPSNAWVGFTRERDYGTSSFGMELLLAPAGLATLDIDFDHSRFRQFSDSLLVSDLGLPASTPGRVVGFIPETDRSTGTVRLHGRIGGRVAYSAGFQISRLHQVGELTPEQRAAGLTDNELIFYSARLLGDVALFDGVSTNFYLNFDRRRNEIQRDTSFFDSTSGNQISEHLRRLHRLRVGGEVVHRIFASTTWAVGARFENIERTLDFAANPGSNVRILPVNALVRDDSRNWSVYARASSRPISGLMVSGELAYQGAPDTGYVTELDRAVIGKVRGSYALPISTPITVSAHARGSMGRNRDFSLVSGVGTAPAGAVVEREFDQSTYQVGMNVSAVPWRSLTLNASFLYGNDAQEFDLVLSNLQRYVQGIAPVNFTRSGFTTLDTTHASFVLGAQMEVAPLTTVGLTYDYTMASSSFSPDATSAELTTIDATSEVDAGIHGIELEAARWLRTGMQMSVGYRVQIYDDSTTRIGGQGSVVPQADPSMIVHTVRVGFTINSDFDLN